MLRKIRIILACVFLIGITLLFVGIGHDWWGWMAKLQFLPSCLALNLAVVIGILAVTLLFGRIYCSVICPMGVFQDVVIWIRRQIGLGIHKINVRRAKNYSKARKEGNAPQPLKTLKEEVKHFSYGPEHRWARYPVLALTVAAIVAGIQVVVAVLAPYSAYGRAVRGFVGIADGSAWTSTVLPLTITGLATLLIIGVCAWFWGREYCNTICPVGTLLSIPARVPLFRIRIDAEKCKACGRCGRGCKASCIDMDRHEVDYSRCVDCFDCINRCKEGAIYFGLKKPSPSAGTSGRLDAGRRDFLAVSALIAGTAVAAKAQEKSPDGSLAPVKAKTAPQRKGTLVPPGAVGEDNFYSHCTACQLCVSACPNKILHPGLSLERFLQPQMGYEHGFCRPECTACSSVCPAGAILPVTREQKTTIHIGTAQADPASCIGCGKCKRECPAGAIEMVKDEESGKRLPVVDPALCIGCGKCEYLCPVRPVSAIVVNGLDTHING